MKHNLDENHRHFKRLLFLRYNVFSYNKLYFISNKRIIFYQQNYNKCKLFAEYISMPFVSLFLLYFASNYILFYESFVCLYSYLKTRVLGES